MQQGREEGRKKGQEEDRKEEKVKIARQLLKIGMPIEQIIEITELSQKEIEKIK